MLRALEELRIDGIETTTEFHHEVLQHAAFVQGQIDTGFIERTWLSSATA